MRRWAARRPDPRHSPPTSATSEHERSNRIERPRSLHANTGTGADQPDKPLDVRSSQELNSITWTGVSRAHCRPGPDVDTFLIHQRRLILLCCGALLLGAPPAGATLPTPTGTVPPEVARAFSSGLLGLPERALTGTSSTPTFWRVPILMVSFTDVTLTYT